MGPGGAGKPRWTLPQEVDRKISKYIEQKERGRFKAEAAALAEKREKPVIQFARDLDISDTVLHRWMQVSRTRAAGGRGTGPVAEGKQGAQDDGGVKLHLTRNPQESGPFDA
jgi:transposase-like protein